MLCMLLDIQYILSKSSIQRCLWFCSEKKEEKKKDIEDILVGPAVAKNVSGFYMTDSMLWFRAYTKPKWSPHLSEFVNFKLIQISSCQSVHSFQLSS